MLEFTSEFGQNFVYATENEKTIYVEKNPKGIFNTVKDSKGIISNVPGHGLLTEEHRTKIAESGLIDAYEEMRALCTEFYINRKQQEHKAQQEPPEQHDIGEP
ncbi:MAG: hypothetical protein ACLFP8_07260 [Alphaproteobacteria bacterium]